MAHGNIIVTNRRGEGIRVIASTRPTPVSPKGIFSTKPTKVFGQTTRSSPSPRVNPRTGANPNTAGTVNPSPKTPAGFASVTAQKNALIDAINASKAKFPNQFQTPFGKLTAERQVGLADAQKEAVDSQLDFFSKLGLNIGRSTAVQGTTQQRKNIFNLFKLGQSTEERARETSFLGEALAENIGIREQQRGEDQATIGTLSGNQLQIGQALQDLSDRVGAGSILPNFGLGGLSVPLLIGGGIILLLLLVKK